MISQCALEGAPKNKESDGPKAPKSAPDAPRSGGLAQTEVGEGGGKGEREGGGGGPVALTSKWALGCNVLQVDSRKPISWPICGYPDETNRL